MSFEFHPEARNEIIYATDWYQERSEPTSLNFELALEEAVSQVIDYPNRWPTYLHGTRCYLLNSFPFGLIYLTQKTNIIGIAVAHLHRKPGYWKNRLSN